MAEPGEPLTEREREIVRLVATGATNRMIAHELSLSHNTIKVHLRNIFSKLEIRSRTEATVIAIREGRVAVGAQGDDLALPGETATPGAHERGLELPASAAADQVPWPIAAETTMPSARLGVVRNVYMLATILVVIAATALTWPRIRPLPAESCNNEFTADCAAANGAVTVDQPESLWVNGAPMIQPRGRFGLVTSNGLLYVIGGEIAEGVTDSVAIYSTREDAWRPGPAKPTAVANLAAVVVNDLVYAIGGTDSSGAAVAAVEVLDVKDESWSTIAPVPAAVTAHAVVRWQEMIYLFGGSNGAGYTADAYVYDPEDDSWRSLPPMPHARGFAGAALVRDAIMVVGGFDGQRESAACDRFDPVTETWSTCPSMSSPRGGIGAADVAGQLYVIGGGWDSFVTFSERYSPHSDAWYNVETPLLLSGGEWRNLGVAAVGTRVYALGGWQGGRYLGVNLAYETLPNRLYLPATSGQ